jgi:hypothetical protein
MGIILRSCVKNKIFFPIFWNPLAYYNSSVEGVNLATVGLAPALNYKKNKHFLQKPWSQSYDRELHRQRCKFLQRHG